MRFKILSFVICSCVWGFGSLCMVEEAISVGVAQIAFGADSTALIEVGQQRDFAAAFSDAVANYKNARMAEDAAEKSMFYAGAVKNINQAIVLKRDYAGAYLLASQIYRGKGGISYAKKYFNKALDVSADKLTACPDDIALNLEYSIMCCAGDARYWTDYSKYKDFAAMQARRVLVLCEQQESRKSTKPVAEVKDNNTNENIVAANKVEAAKKDYAFSKFLAYIVLEDYDNALLTAEKILAQTQANALQKELAALYKDSVAQGKYLWVKNNRENAEKEFLLHCMTFEDCWNYAL